MCGEELGSRQLERVRAAHDRHACRARPAARCASSGLCNGMPAGLESGPVFDVSGGAAADGVASGVASGVAASDVASGAVRPTDGGQASGAVGLAGHPAEACGEQAEGTAVPGLGMHEDGAALLWDGPGMPSSSPADAVYDAAYDDFGHPEPDAESVPGGTLDAHGRLVVNVEHGTVHASVPGALTRALTRALT